MEIKENRTFLKEWKIFFVINLLNGFFWNCTCNWTQMNSVFLRLKAISALSLSLKLLYTPLRIYFLNLLRKFCANVKNLLSLATLSTLKIPCLEPDRKEAKQIYQDNLNSYTLNLLGRPLEKLHVSLLSEILKIE